MNYTQQLTSLLEEILNEFEDDPQIGFIHYGADANPTVVSEELDILLERANDLIYGPEGDATGYPTEEGE